MGNSTENHFSASLLNNATLDLLRATLFNDKPINEKYDGICKVVCNQLNLTQVSILHIDTQSKHLALIAASSNKNQPKGFSEVNHYIEYWQKQQFFSTEQAQQENLLTPLKSYLQTHNIASIQQFLIGSTNLILSLESHSPKWAMDIEQSRFFDDIKSLISELNDHQRLLEESVYYRNLYREYESVFDGTNYGIVSTDTQGVIRSFNRGASLMLGYSAEEMIGKTPEIFHDRQEVIKRAAELTVELNTLIEPGFEAFVAKTRRGEIEEKEWTFIHKDGHKIPVLLSVCAIRNDEQEITGFLGIAIDISDRVLTSRAIRQQEATYRLLYEASADGIFLVHDGIIIDCNPAALHLFACKRDQIVGQPPERFFPQTQPNGDNSTEIAQKKIYAALNGKNQFFEWQHITYEGTPFESEVTLNTFMVDDKVLLLGIIRDISERKKTEQELEHSRNDLITKNRNLLLLNELSSHLLSLTNLKEIYDETIKTMIKFIDDAQIAIYEFDKRKNSLIMKAHHRVSPEIIDTFNNINLEDSLTGQALKTRSLVAYEDIVKSSPLANKNQHIFQTRNQTNELVVVPLYFHNLQLGTMNISFDNPRVSLEYEKEIFATIGKTLSLSIVNSLNIKALKFNAEHDSLTQLGNRPLFHDYVKKHLTEKQPSSATVILFDLDRFKEINDTLGHHIGDLLLQQIGPRIESQLSDYEYLLCRLGGDEFTLFIADKLTDNEREALCLKLHQSMKQPFYINNMHLEIDSSFGVAIYPENGTNSHSLLRSADVAMYHAKHQHLGVYFYSPEIDSHTPERLMLLSELKAAISERELILHYQPKLCLQTKEVVGFEALIRWQHPSRGLLYPDSFMPLAEVSDIIYPLTDHVIELAMEQQKEWREQGKDYSVSVNISARNLMDERLYFHLKEMLETHQTPAQLFELELTETALMQDPERAITILERIATLNVKLSVDDFGTGYSSLAYLRRLPLTALKIDRVFVNEMLSTEQDEIIVNSTIALAHNLKLKVIAEGVEDSTTIDRLQSLRCDQVQGYYLSPPKAWPDMQKWLDNNKY